MPYLRGLWDLGASQVALVVKNLPAIQETQETWVPSLGWEDPLKEGSGNPLQYSCLENPRQRSLMGNVNEVAKSWTRLSMHTVGPLDDCVCKNLY